MKSSSPRRCLRIFWLVLAAGLALRLLLFYGAQATPLKIVDEQHYHSLAANILLGNGFCFEPGRPTSIRPPLYPAFVAGVGLLAGIDNLQAVRVVQMGLSLSSVLLLYRLGILLFDQRVATLGSLGFWTYPSFIGYDHLLLTEVLFTCLLIVVALGYVKTIGTGKSSVALGTGAALGLAALARSILWLFPLILCPLLCLSAPGNWLQKLRISGLLLLGFLLVVGPWSIRNTRLQGVFTAVDTMGGINLRMGNYEHTPLERPWDAVALNGEESWTHQLGQEHPDAGSWTEGQKEKWATRKALAYMADNPGLTSKRVLFKFCDFWGLEREFIAGFQQGLYAPGWWFVVMASASITASYAILMMLATLGLYFNRPLDRRAHAFFLALFLFVCGLHAIVFGHSRYHLPLVPFLILYAAAAVINRSWRRLGESLWVTVPCLSTALLLVCIWSREVFIRDLDRIQEVLRASM